LVAITAGTAQPRSLVLDNVRVIDGSGGAPLEGGRVVIQGDRITSVGPADRVAMPAGADRIDLTGRTIVPGLIDLHFHIENDPKLALRQLSRGVTAFRDPGQWDEKFVELRRMIAADHLAGPRIFTTGPHIDGEHPAYPADSVVARDPEEARRAAELSIQHDASAIKIYFRLPFASARAVIDVCEARHVPCTAHLELLDARELIAVGLNGIEHVTSLGTSVVPRRTAEAYRQDVLADNEARRDGRYKLFAGADLDGPEAQALYALLRARTPWLDPTLAVFERRADRPEKGAQPEMVRVMAAGFAKMKQLTRRPRRRAAGDGWSFDRAVCNPRRGALARARTARGQRTVSARGDHRRNRNCGGFPVPQRSTWHITPRPAGRSGDTPRQPASGYFCRPDRRTRDGWRALGGRWPLSSVLVVCLLEFTTGPLRCRGPKIAVEGSL
jgi:hypothetical protein